jgi:cytochrome b561
LPDPGATAARAISRRTGSTWLTIDRTRAAMQAWSLVVEPEPRWPLATKCLHWGVVLLVLAAVPAGFLMSATYAPALRDDRVRALHDLLSQIHHTLGIIVLLTVIVWAVRSLQRQRPAWPAPVSGWERASARVVHIALLLVLIAVPWSGWSAISALADSEQFGRTHRWFFATDGLLPRIWPARPWDDPAGYGLFARLHIASLWAGLGLLSVHAAAAMWHHFYRRDAVLRRMWPLGAADRER